ncbi:MAG: PKD domain-containing protein [Bacteroidetes bacterium]|nr:MAG: PKD domain-containing protein [Bacteroidota bacterium]
MKHNFFACPTLGRTFLIVFSGCISLLSADRPEGNLFAQSTVTIGTGTSVNMNSVYPAPYGNYYWGAKHQILIPASELTAAGMTAGNISALSFQVSVPGGIPLNGFTILLKTTTATTTAAPFDMSGFVTVYGPQNYSDVTGWNTHTFSTPFAWNGTSNILVETCFNNSSWSQNAEMFYTTTGYNSASYYQQDLSNVCSQTSGIPSTLRPNMKFTFAPNGPPTAQFTANPTSSCSGAMSFTDQSFYSITGWLWNFGDGGTSTLQNPTHTYTASGIYSVSLTATNANGNNTLSKPNYITVNLGVGPIPAVCTPTTTAWCCGFGITNFKFHNINNSSADGSEGYKDFSCGLDTVTTGQTYSVSVSTLTPSGHNVRVWIDLNNDGTFNPANELVFSADNSSIASGTIFIPGSTTLNTPLRMRVSADHSLQPVPTPCGNPQFGQAEDYALYVKPNTNPPVAKFSADDTVSCSGTITFTDQSQNVPTLWTWNFGDGGVSNSQNPIHSYTASGTYSVSLLATNGNGNNTLVKINYIDVTLGNTPIAPSCQPSTFSYCCGYGIYKVQLGTINNSSADAIDGYRDYSCDAQATLSEGQSYPISIQTCPTLTQDTKVWIDFNKNGLFTELNELVFTSLTSINPSGNISIPMGVGIYNTLLRMRVSSENSGANQQSCTALIKGQVEDYGIKILQFVGTNELQVADYKCQIYPNPFSESAVLAVNLPLAKGVGLPPADRGDFVFVLYDLYGRAIRTQTILNEKTTLERGNLNAGVYFYKVENATGAVVTGKIVIQ